MRTRQFMIMLLALALAMCAQEARATARLFTVNIPFETGREVRVKFPDGTEKQIGAIVSSPRMSIWPGFDAAKWAKPGTVCASSVNAIHLLLDIENGRGRIISLLPTHTTAPAARPAGAVLIEGIGGTGLWASWAPPVGTQIFAVDEHGNRAPLGVENFKTAKSLEYSVFSRSDAPYYVEFENKYDGIVTLVWPDKERVIAKVVHPTNGIGFFDGTQYQGIGRVRANHPGVLCISTSPHGERGGFQIIPSQHAKSPEMKAAWYEPQWMIIEPIVPENSAPGTEPIFSGFLVPGPHPYDGLEAEAIWDQIVRIPFVHCKLAGSDEWIEIPEVVANGPDSPMRKITHIRVLFPFEIKM